MNIRGLLIGAASALAIGLSALTAEAAPLNTGSSDLAATVKQLSDVQNAAYRRCWWRYGVRHCRYVGYYPYRPYYYYDDYPYYRYGYGPGVRVGPLYFGF